MSAVGDVQRAHPPVPPLDEIRLIGGVFEVVDELVDGQLLAAIRGDLVGVDQILCLSDNDAELGLTAAELLGEGVFEAGRIHA